MVELKIYLPEPLDKKFRRLAMSVYGHGRGSISKAAVEALSAWCSAHEPSGVTGGTDHGLGQDASSVATLPHPKEKGSIQEGGAVPVG